MFLIIKIIRKYIWNGIINKLRINFKLRIIKYDLLKSIIIC
jgi:hypothetical protein